MSVLVIGATGYIGGRLVPELLAAGHRVRCLARTPARLRDRHWYDAVEVVAGDVLDAEVAGLRPRMVVQVPLLTPGLSSRWVGLVTPLPVGLARPLVDSLVNEVVVTGDAIRSLVPRRPMTMREAFEAALRRIQDLEVTTTWAGAGLTGAARATASTPATAPVASMPQPVAAADPAPSDPPWAGGTVLSDERTVASTASPEAMFATLEGLGGKRGWYSAGWMWRIRGWMDSAVGGIGMRRGRRHPDHLAVGDALDSWRVEVLDRPHCLRLRAEMRLPGEAWLEFRVTPDNGGSRLEQRARFVPRRLWGRVYWWVLVPFHGLIFPQMARRIAAAAESRPTPVTAP